MVASEFVDGGRAAGIMCSGSTYASTNTDTNTSTHAEAGTTRKGGGGAGS